MTDIESVRVHLKLIDQVGKQAPEQMVWQALQKYLMATEQPEFALLTRQIKKLPFENREKLVELFSEFHVHSKLWCIEELRRVLPSWPDRVIILGGWAGQWALAFKWLSSVRQIFSVDLDIGATELGRHLSEPYCYKEIEFVQTDLRDFVAQHIWMPQDLVVCSVMEHLCDPLSWQRSIPKGTLVAWQGSSDSKPSDHVHPFSSIGEFKAATPLEVTLFEGTLNWAQADRFMRIGLI